MPEIHVSTTLDSLERDLREIAVRSASDCGEIVDRNLEEGNTIARAFAKESAGRHGKHYPSAFTVDHHPDAPFAEVIVFGGEYGPDASMPQGNMSFEYGSRNQKPHLDLAKSADIVGPKMEADVLEAIDRWFWPET
jgi:hypothetical protein